MPLDIERLALLGMEIDYVSHYVDAVLGSIPSMAIDPIRALPDVVMLESQGTGVPLMASAGPSVGINRVHENLGFDGTGVTVAVLDTGIRATHASLDDLDDDPFTDDPKMVVFYDAYANRTADPYDSGEHGTWVAGLATGTGQPGGQNIGGAPGAKLVGVRIGSPGGFPESTALRGLEWVMDNKDTYNISVAVCSWGILLGGPNDHNGNSAISRAADRMVEAGISVVVAAGNSALSATVTAPGDANDVVTVGSVNDNHVLSSFSSEGPTTDGRTKPDVCAPGEDITGPWSNGDGMWYEGDGTSAAAPIVGGIIATMVQANPDLTPAQVKQILHETSEHNTAFAPRYLFTPNNGYGWGVVHAPGAVSRALDLRSPTIDIPVSLESGEEQNLEVIGSYTRTAFTELGENGESRLGEDEVIIDVSIPDDWDRPSRVTYEMVGDIIATVVPEPISQEGGEWKLTATFRVRTDVSTLTTAQPTIRFTTSTPVTSEIEAYALTSRETINNMVGPLGRTRVSVGGNVPPEIELVNPDGGSDTANNFYVIRWNDDDPDDNAHISLYNDDDTEPSSGRVLIASNIMEDPEGDGDSYTWDTSTLVGGRSYYVQAVIDDGTNGPVSVYSTGTVTISHTGNSPPFVEVLEPDGTGDVADMSYTIEYVARDADDVAKVSLFWDSDASGFDGNAIVRDLSEDDGPAKYVWDTSSQPDGARLYIYAVVSDGSNPQARAYGKGPLTITHDHGPRVEDAQPRGTDVDLDEVLRVTFDREMDHGSTQTATSIDPAAPGTFSWVGVTMRFTPAGGWNANTQYDVIISTAAEDGEGRPMDMAHTWAFKTGSGTQPTDPPRVVIEAPEEGAILKDVVWIEGSSENLGAGGHVEVRIDGETWEGASGNEHWSLPWDTSETFDGGHTISVRGTDSGGKSSHVAMVNVTVRNAANSPPVLEPIPDRSVKVGNTMSVQVVATDGDGDDLSYSDDSPLFDVDVDTGLVTFSAGEGHVGTHSVTITVSDGLAQTEATFLITVEEKGSGGTSLDWLPLTPTQLILALGILAVMAIGLIAWRGARTSKEDNV
jgi:hypothetical protein